MVEKDSSGGSMDKGTELDDLLSAADQGILDAIRHNLDLGTGFAQIAGSVAKIPPASRLTGPAEAEPDTPGCSHDHVPEPAPASEFPIRPRKIPAPKAENNRGELLYRHGALIMLALAAVMALNIAMLLGLSQNRGVITAQPGIGLPGRLFKPIPGEPARGFPLPRPQVIVLAGKAGASVSLRFPADIAGFGGNPAISYIRDSPSGAVLLLSGLPEGTATRFLSMDKGQPCADCSAVTSRNYPFPPGGEQFLAGTAISIGGHGGRVILKTLPDQPSSQIDVVIAWLPDWA